MPDTAFVKFKWRYYVNWVSGVGDSYILNNFRGNSLYDPDQTGVGDQPTGFDQWMNFYDHYDVQGSKIKLTIDNKQYSAGVTPPLSMIVTIFPSTGYYDPTVIGTQPPDKQPMAFSKILAPYNSGNSYSRVKMRGYMTTNKMYGRRGTMEDEDFHAALNTNPAKQWYWNVVLQEITGSTANRLAVTGVIEIVYYAVLSRRQWLTNS